PTTFARSRLDPGRRHRPRHRQLFGLYRELLLLRRAYVAPRRLTSRQVGVDPSDASVLWVDRRPPAPSPSLAIFRCGPGSGEVHLPPVRRALRLRLASADRRWLGPGADLTRRLVPGDPCALDLPPWSFAFYAAPAGA
ncbi:MAG: hypothetical protein WA547_03755, partial [Thermoplasmata archaeon]